MPNVNIGKALSRSLFDSLGKFTPRVVFQSLEYYNNIIISGDIERARAQIKVEFMKNRQVAELIYKKYKDEMNSEVANIFEEMMGDANGQ